MKDVKYYDGTKLLSLNDINGNRPEIYIVTTNRTGGKTTYFGRLLVNRFLKNHQKFCLLYRYNYEVDDCVEKFWKDIQVLFFKEYNMTSEKGGNGTYRKLFLNNIECGYAISLNSADQIKKHSHLFSDVSCILFDEFQSETNTYCNDEIKKFISIHTSIARGRGEQVRYVPVYMLSNPVSLINPYYTEMGIANRLRDDTKFLRGDGWVLEQGYVESADISQKQSGFMKAFSNNEYSAYSSQGVYLNDNKTFIDKPKGKFRYLGTIAYKGKEYSIKEYPELGIIYCDNSVDKQFPLKISATLDDHNINYVMLRQNDMFIGMLKYYFEHGCMRFADLNCKDCVINIISI